MMSDLISRSWMMEQLDGLGDTRLIKRNFIALVTNAPTVDAVPVSELKKLRDYLYAEDLIFMRGLAKLNKLIAQCSAKMDKEKSE